MVRKFGLMVLALPMVARADLVVSSMLIEATASCEDQYAHDLDTQSASSGMVTAGAQVGTQNFRQRAAAFQSWGGFNGVAVSGMPWDSDHINRWSSTLFDVAVFNSGAAPLPVVFRFEITGGYMDVFNYTIEDATLELSNSIRVGSDSLWGQQLTLVTGAGGSSLTESLDDPQNIGTPAHTHSDNGTDAHVTVSGFSGVLNLGTLGPGESMDVKYEMNALAYDQWGTDLAAAIGDPFNLVPGVTFSIDGVTLPTPATASVFGLAGLVLTRRRR